MSNAFELIANILEAAIIAQFFFEILWIKK